MERKVVYEMFDGKRKCDIKWHWEKLLETPLTKFNTLLKFKTELEDAEAGGIQLCEKAKKKRRGFF